MDIVPFYQSGNQVLLALDADITLLPVKDNLVVMLKPYKGRERLNKIIVENLAKIRLKE